MASTRHLGRTLVTSTLAAGLLVGLSVAPASAAVKSGYKVCTTDHPVAVQAQTTGSGNIQAYDQYGRNARYSYFYHGSRYKFDFLGSGHARANWKVDTNGIIRGSQTYAYCTSS